MELLARGSFTDKETLISANYAKGLYQVLAALNCLCKDESNRGMINMDKVKKRLVSGVLHVEYLNQTLKKDCEFILDEDQMAEGEIKLRNLMGKKADGAESGEELQQQQTGFGRNSSSHLSSVPAAVK